MRRRTLEARYWRENSKEKTRTNQNVVDEAQETSKCVDADVKRSSKFHARRNQNKTAAKKSCWVPRGKQGEVSEDR